MPVEYTHIAGKGLLLKGRGRVRGKDIAEIKSAIYETRRKIKSIAYQICDFTEVKEVNLSVEDVRKIASQDEKASEINPSMLIAVVGEKDVVYGFARKWEAYVDKQHFETRVFRNLEDAQNWIASKTESKLP